MSATYALSLATAASSRFEARAEASSNPWLSSLRRPPRSNSVVLHLVSHESPLVIVSFKKLALTVFCSSSCTLTNMSCIDRRCGSSVSSSLSLSSSICRRACSAAAIAESARLSRLTRALRSAASAARRKSPTDSSTRPTRLVSSREATDEVVSCCCVSASRSSARCIRTLSFLASCVSSSTLTVTDWDSFEILLSMSPTASSIRRCCSSSRAAVSRWTIASISPPVTASSLATRSSTRSSSPSRAARAAAAARRAPAACSVASSTWDPRAACRAALRAWESERRVCTRSTFPSISARSASVWVVTTRRTWAPEDRGVVAKAGLSRGVSVKDSDNSVPVS
mmetsp:Transcript_63278/g.145516  ORF Transcript_63278/g.145516 Transcript_63278/m.145516 type:complete len:340 (+) Transcript_63278:2566-3585(+)